MRKADQPLEIAGFTGTTTERKISTIAKASEADTAQVKAVLALPEFNWLIATLEAVGDRQMYELDEGDANDAILLHYYQKISDAIRQAIDGPNGRSKPENQRLGPYAILAAERIVEESELHPHLSFMDLPRLEDIKGRDEWQIGMERMVGKYDRTGVVPKDLYE